MIRQPFQNHASKKSHSDLGWFGKNHPAKSLDDLGANFFWRTLKAFDGAKVSVVELSVFCTDKSQDGTGASDKRFHVVSVYSANTLVYIKSRQMK